MLPPEIRAYYEDGHEVRRILEGNGRLELLRTQELVRRYLPPPGARVLDVGGATGAHARWLAEDGYEVHVIDPVAAQVEQAAALPCVTAAVGDASALSEPDQTADVVLLLGPLYHLATRPERVRAVREARRVLRPGGLLAAAAVSRFASLHDGLLRGMVLDPDFEAMIIRVLATGQHHPPAGRGWFTTAYFHRPAELASEVRDAGFVGVEVLAVEGAAWLLPDLDRYLDDDVARAALLRNLARVEREPSLIGVSAHLLAVAHAPSG